MTNSRIAPLFERTASEGRAALVLYLTACWPDAETNRALIEAIAEAGCDVLELGVPFSDPIADGPTIQRASAEALAAGATLDKVFALAGLTRDVRPPTVLFSALNPIFHRGYARSAADARAVAIDGVLAPDLPIEEDPELGEALRGEGLDLIYLAAPTTPAARKVEIAAATSGFLYYISLKGVTGARTDMASDIAEQLAPVRAASRMPVAVGFGISRPEQANIVARQAEGVVVGSALIDTIARHRGGPRAKLLAEVKAFVGELAAAMQR
jgi:tryptophan synthase alpha chain